MAKFCTACGSDLSPDAAFCEECGKPTAAAAPQPKPAPTPALKPATKPLPLPGGAIRLAAIALAVVLAGAGGLYFMLREASLPEGTALAKLLDSDEAGRLERTCLNNFDYSKNPVNVAIYDNGTKAWLNLLVNANIYSGPRRVTQSRGFFFEEFWQYEHGEAAAKAIKDKRLCFASGIAVDRVNYQEINRQLPEPVVVGNVTYRYVDQAPWSTTEEARQIGPSKLAETNELQIFLRLKDGEWQRSQLTPREMAELSGKQSKASAASPGFIDQLFGMFKGNPAAPILGKWRTTTGLVSIDIEFKADSILISGMEEEVSYRREGEQVIVLKKGSEQRMLVLDVISSDELRLLDGGVKITLKRDR
jgi:hypothetical protein